MSRLIRHVGCYIGGPLDGAEALPVRGRWSIYRTDEGTPLAAARGDAEFIYRHNAGKEIRRYYVHVAETPATRAENGVQVLQHLYVYGPHYRTWRTEKKETA